MSEQSLNNNTAFPYEIFPYEIIKLLEDAEKTLNYPIEYLGSAILSASSIAIGNTCNIKLKEGFVQKPNLFIALVGNAGDVKTHPLNFAFQPIEEVEKQSYSEYKTKLKEYNSFDIDTQKNTAKPIYKKSILKDFTPEALIKIHSNNLRGLTILSDELFGWINNFNRYSSSGEQETYLSLWSGGSISVDRKNDEPIRLDNPFVGVIGTIQTKLLSDLGKNNRGNNGFIERMLFAINENPKPVLWSENEIKKERISDYKKLIRNLLLLDFTDYQSNILALTKEAKEYLIKWQNEKSALYYNDDVSRSIQAKYEVYTVRFSLIIQLIHWAMHGIKSKEKIELFAVEHAITLSEYYFQNALKIHNKIFNVNPLEKLTEEQLELYKILPQKFTSQKARKEGENLGINERTIYRFLKNSRVFSIIKKGSYKKLA